MAGMDRSYGRPLPYRQANPPQTHLRVMDRIQVFSFQRQTFQCTSPMEFCPQFPKVILPPKVDCPRVTELVARTLIVSETCMSSSDPNSSDLEQDQLDLLYGSPKYFIGIELSYTQVWPIQCSNKSDMTRADYVLLTPHIS